jgi:hypothetical protein
VACEKDDHLMIRLHARGQVIDGRQDVLLGGQRLALAFVREQAHVIRGQARGSREQVADGARVFVRVREFLNLAGVVADADQQRPLIVGGGGLGRLRLGVRLGVGRRGLRRRFRSGLRARLRLGLPLRAGKDGGG